MPAGADAASDVHDVVAAPDWIDTHRYVAVSSFEADKAELCPLIDGLEADAPR